tara:strand:- start:2671 stop:2835 length:165 start_codon:yes stop_codon:yes gene_type:complete
MAVPAVLILNGASFRPNGEELANGSGTHPVAEGQYCGKAAVAFAFFQSFIAVYL